MYLLRFIVVGSGIFPLDMLRYDYCYPQNAEDALAIGDQDFNTTAGKRRVKLEQRNAQGLKARPTIERWRSFGWEVSPATISTMKM